MVNIKLLGRDYEEKRNAAIIRAHDAGASYAALGRQYGISSERVRQIVLRYVRRVKQRPLFGYCGSERNVD